MIAAALGALMLLSGRRLRPRRAERPAIEPVAYFEAVAAELDRGASLRHAVALPLPASRLARLAVTGQPIGAVAAEMERVLAPGDPFVVAAVTVAARSGAPPARLFTLLADRERRAIELRSHRRVRSAQARMSAGVLALLPLAVAVVLVMARAPGVLSHSGPARTAVAVGGAMQLLGVTAMSAILRRHR